jgi:hypothetical protein
MGIGLMLKPFRHGLDAFSRAFEVIKPSLLALSKVQG